MGAKSAATHPWALADNSLGCVGTWAQTLINLGITSAPEYTHMGTNDQFMSEYDTEI